jgi:hypothetical protein
MKKEMACATRAFCRPCLFGSFVPVLRELEATRQKNKGRIKIKICL